MSGVTSNLLPVARPHQQGRITKVLNMKPPEILGMIEEAAGTRMFEHKKQSALKTIDKKQIKVSGTWYNYFLHPVIPTARNQSTFLIVLVCSIYMIPV